MNFPTRHQHVMAEKALLLNAVTFCVIPAIAISPCHRRRSRRAACHLLHGVVKVEETTGLDDAEKKCEEQHGDDAELNRSSAALPCLVPGKFPAAQHDFPLSVHM